jgi:hypothetical protein
MARASAPAVLEIGEPVFARHGPKAVFIGRWILVWNAAGGISWATTMRLVGKRA